MLFARAGRDLKALYAAERHEPLSGKGTVIDQMV
jgi:hypothetical protein